MDSSRHPHTRRMNAARGEQTVGPWSSHRYGRPHTHAAVRMASDETKKLPHAYMAQHQWIVCKMGLRLSWMMPHQASSQASCSSAAS